MILAGITSQYGYAYFLAIDSSVFCSSSERFNVIKWAFFLGIKDKDTIQPRDIDGRKLALLEQVADLRITRFAESCERKSW
jgi:hypothetical protein